MVLSMMPEDNQAYLELRWHLSDIEAETIILSNFVEFGGVKAIRMRIKNLEHQRCTLNLFAHQLRQTGIELESVVCRVDELEWIDMKKQGCQTIVFFTAIHSDTLRSCQTLTFRALITHPVPNYRFVLRDSMLKNQLWMAASKDAGNTDLDIRIQNRTFIMHKSLVAARSSVFSAELKQLTPPEADYSPRRTRITLPDLEPNTVEAMLKYMYTGEFEVPVSNPEEFRNAAATYNLSTLTELCELPLQESLKAIDLVELLGSLEVTPRKLPLPVRCAKEEATKSHTGFVVPFTDCLSDAAEGNFKFMGETAFGWRYSPIDESDNLQICFFSSLSLDTDLYVYDVICRHEGNPVTMTESHQDNDCVVQIFNATVTRGIDEFICFEVFIRSRVESVAVELVDVLGSEELWNAAQKGELTDVEFQIGNETFYAHRWLVSARSPEFVTLFSDLLLEEAANCDVTSSLRSRPDNTSTTETAKKTSVIKIKDVAPDVFYNILQYMYTGKLTVAPSKPLLMAAEKYHIETLEKLCEIALRDIDFVKLSSKLLSY